MTVNSRVIRHGLLLLLSVVDRNGKLNSNRVIIYPFIGNHDVQIENNRFTLVTNIDPTLMFKLSYGCLPVQKDLQEPSATFNLENNRFINKNRLLDLCLNLCQIFCFYFEFADLNPPEYSV